MRTSRWPVFLGGVTVLCLLGCGGAELNERGAAALAVDTATVPITLDHNRVIVEIALARTDGGLRRATAWVDTGNQFLIVGGVAGRGARARQFAARRGWCGRLGGVGVAGAGGSDRRSRPGYGGDRRPGP